MIREPEKERDGEAAPVLFAKLGESKNIRQLLFRLCTVTAVLLVQATIVRLQSAQNNLARTRLQPRSR